MHPSVFPKIDKTWRPLTDFLESDFYKNFPLETFGMSRGGLYDLMSHNPQKFSSLIATFVGLARHYEMEPQEFSKLALRSYRESKEHHFPEIEERAIEVRKELLKQKGEFITEDLLNDYLKSHFKTSIHTLKAEKLPVWPPGEAVVLAGKR